MAGDPVALSASVSATDKVYRTLKEAIASAALAPGQPIIEASVGQKLGVSSTPVREALQRLAQDGLVVLMRSRGAFVVSLTLTDVKELYELRALLEPAAVKLAVPRFESHDLEELRATLEEARVAFADGRWDQLSTLNRRFHGYFIQGCGNSRLEQTLQRLQDFNRIIAMRVWQFHGYRPEEGAEHRSVFEAALQHEAETAAARMEQHILAFGRIAAESWSRMPVL